MLLTFPSLSDKLQIMDNVKLPISRLQPKFRELTLAYKDKTKRTQKAIADMVGLKESNLSALLQKPREDKPISRVLTANHIEMFIRKGVFRMADIYDHQPESDRERFFWNKMYFSQPEHQELTELLEEADKQGKLEKVREMLKLLTS